MLQPSWVRHGRMVLGSTWRPFQQQAQAYLLAHLPDMSAPACCPQVWWQCSPVSRHVTEAAVNMCLARSCLESEKSVLMKLTVLLSEMPTGVTWGFYYISLSVVVYGNNIASPFVSDWKWEQGPIQKKGSLHSNTSSRATITIPRQVSKEQNTRHRRETDYAMSALLRFVHPPQMVLVAVRDRMLGWRELSMFQSDNFYIPKTTR